MEWSVVVLMGLDVGERALEWEILAVDKYIFQYISMFASFSTMPSAPSQSKNIVIKPTVSG